ncbi:hypothetical protein EXIGLDRAFT_666906 [Exidia glandulosa HHB12029]|uniref:CENP-V/GFA domain-containing protein n=1 Tax=Exidia glandulosa HHB12029 TaxID=1314781 RepID=A0A165NJY0_EXIGL|nr:hypothetical protein EXIGLDRAFT_666906 [Exidia glandulosa HHB12029]
MSTRTPASSQIPEPGTFKPHTYEGGCHCGRVKFSVVAPPPDEIVVTACNCSFCSARGGRMIYMKPESLTFTKGSFDDLTKYLWNSKTAWHSFCPVCGIAVGGEYQGNYSINMRCFEGAGIEVEKLKVQWKDGKGQIPRFDGA